VTRYHLTMEPSAALVHKLSDEERAEVLKKAQEELPKLDKSYEEATSNLNKIAKGLRPER
jgi:capsule polysaccharide export protein KpsE/RkpR